MRKIFLPDVNVWVALAFDHHGHHGSALTWVNAVGSEALAFCRMTQQGLLRLATNGRVMGTHVLTLAEAWALYDQISADSRVMFVPEPPGVESRWRQLTQANQPSTHVWADAYLAAFAFAGDYEIVTFDQGFAQFKLGRCTILT